MTVLSAQRFDNSRDGGCSTLEVRETSVPLKETSVTGSVQGPLASLVLNQLFDCSFLKEGTSAEAVYRFPLPGDAILRGVTVTFGNVRIATRLAEREEAQAEYDDAVEKGHQAALVTRESDDAFTLRIAGIAKDEPVRVETAFLLWLRPTADGVSLRLPLTLAPRYVRDDEAKTPRANAQPLESSWDPRHRVRLSLLCRGVAGAECPTNAIRTADEGGALHVTFAEDTVWPDQDLVLEFRSAPRDADGPVRLDVFAAADDDGDGDGTFLALASPAGAPTATEEAGAPRDLLLLVDHSGSMQGPKWEAADWAVKTLLSRLGDDDAFNLGFFHDTCRWMARSPVKATEKNRQRGERFIAESTDSGGTELGLALEQALWQPRSEGRAARHVVVLTDAQVSDHDRIGALLERESARGDFRRVSVVCIDAAPNEPLASAMAETGRGIACFLTSNPDEVDIATALDDIFLEFSRPLALGLRLEGDAELAEATGRYTACDGSLDLGDLPAGRPRWICGHFRRNGAVGPVAFRLKDDAGATLASASVDPETSGGEWSDAIRGLYGALRVRRLEALAGGPERKDLPAILTRMGLDSLAAEGEPERRTMYPENAGRANADIERLLIRESLYAGVPCSKTAFVAIREEAGTKVSERLLVPNALPRGWDAGFAVPMRCMPAPVCECEESTMSDDFAGAAPEPQAQAPVMRRMSVSAPGGSRSVSGILKNMGILRGKTPRAMSAGSGFTAERPAAPSERTLFDGPVASGEADMRLFDGVAGSGGLVGLGYLRALVVEATRTEGAGAENVEIRILVNGSVAAKVRLADLLRLGGRRPLNIRLRDGDRVSIELEGANSSGIGRLRVSVG